MRKHLDKNKNMYKIVRLRKGAFFYMELRGNIKDFPLPDIIQLIGAGNKTGMLSVMFKKNKAALYFDKGNIVHASMLSVKGIDAVTKMFQIAEGRFHFYADVKPEKKTFNVNPTALLMQAMSTYDEKRKAAGHFDKSGKSSQTRKKVIFELKQEMIKIIRDLYGNKAKKIEQLINKCDNSELELMGSCDKIEKYIYVFLDSQNYKTVSDKLRHLIEETH